MRTEQGPQGPLAVGAVELVMGPGSSACPQFSGLLGELRRRCFACCLPVTGLARRQDLPQAVRDVVELAFHTLFEIGLAVIELFDLCLELGDPLVIPLVGEDLVGARTPRGWRCLGWWLGALWLALA